MANRNQTQQPSRSSSRIASRNNPSGSSQNQHIASTSGPTLSNNNPLGNQSLPNNNTSDQNISNMSTNSAPDANQTVVQNVIPPLMASNVPPPTGLQTTSSPGTNTAVGSPEFSSATAQEVRNQFERDSRQQPLLENVNLEAPINSNDGPSLREYITASVRIAQNQALRTMEERLAVMIPQVVRNSIDSLRNSSFNTQDPNRSEQEPTLNSHYMPNNFEQRQQQTNNNNREHYSQNFSQNFAIGCKPMTPLQLQKWGLKFDGSSKNISIEEFVFRAESLRVDYSCPWDVFVKGFHHLLAGRAYDWIWQFRQQNPLCEWEFLKYNLIKKFRNFESDFEIQRKIIERRQLPNETADIFISEIIKLKNQMRVPIPELEIVRIIKDNLKEGLVQLIYARNIESIDVLIEECRRAEANISKRMHYRQPQQQFRRIHEIEFDNDSCDPTSDVEAIHATTTAKQITCWNCKKAGHTYIECEVEQRNIFCYKCGFDGVTSPKCPRCVGNRFKSMGNAGNPCSQKDTSQ